MQNDSGANGEHFGSMVLVVSRAFFRSFPDGQKSEFRWVVAEDKIANTCTAENEKAQGEPARAPAVMMQTVEIWDQSAAEDNGKAAADHNKTSSLSPRTL